MIYVMLTEEQTRRDQYYQNKRPKNGWEFIAKVVALAKAIQRDPKRFRFKKRMELLAQESKEKNQQD